MYEKEKLIREQRTIEATRKGLMGLDGKLGCILRFLGKPVLGESGGWFESNEGEDFHSHLFEDEGGKKLGEPIESGNNEVDDGGWRGTSQEFAGIRRASEDDGGMQIGWHFDGLSRGMHLEIQYMEERHELAVSWKGYSVYREVAGELHQYVPGDWEDSVNQLHTSAKKKENVARRFGVEDMKEESYRKKLNFLETLRQLWGV